MPGSGYDTDLRTALVATVVAVKASGGRLYGIDVSNPNAAVAFIQVFDLAAADITLGTTVPKLSLMVPVSNADCHFVWPMGISFGIAIRIAATTTFGGSTAPTTGLVVNTIFL